MARYGSGSAPIATGWKCTNCHRTHRSSIPQSASGNTRARRELTTGTSRPPRNWSAPCPGSSETCKSILNRSDPICFLFADRNVPLIMRGCIAVAVPPNMEGHASCRVPFRFGKRRTASHYAALAPSWDYCPLVLRLRLPQRAQRVAEDDALPAHKRETQVEALRQVTALKVGGDN